MNLQDTKINNIDEILQSGGDSMFFPETTSNEPAPEIATDSDDHNAKAGFAETVSPEVGFDEPAEEEFAVDCDGDLSPSETKVTKTSRKMGMSPDELPREKMQKHGKNSLTDVELLAILLGSGIKGKPVLEFAREILSDNDNRLSVLAQKEVTELMRKYKGLGLAKATLLVAAMNFGQRAQADMRFQKPQIKSSNDVYEYMRDKLENANHEEFWVIHLSRANRILSAEQISKGGIAQTAVDIKLIAKSAIDHLASGIILCHNHPSGNMVPSGPDDMLTRNIVEICKICDVKVLDHVIVGPTGYYSYQDNGRI